MTPETKPIAVETPKHLTRTGILNALFPKVLDGLQGIKDLNACNPEHVRRVFRALVTIGIRLMLDNGVSPQKIVAQAIEAVGHELEERKVKAKADGTNVPQAAGLN